MKELLQQFRNRKMSMKLLVSYALIVAVAITGMGLVLLRSTRERLKNGAEQMLAQTAQVARSTLQERCVRVERSLNYLSSDTYVQGIINEEHYLSEYQKAYDVNNYLEPTIISVMEQNPLIDDLVFYTYGEVKNTRIFLRDIEEASDPAFHWGEQPRWTWDGENIRVSRVLVNTWQPNRSAILVATVDRESLFADLLPESNLDCRVQILDENGTVLLERSSISDPALWESHSRETETCTLAGTGWTLLVEGDTTPRTQMLRGSVLLPMCLILGGLCVLMLLAAWRFSAGISRRLDRLREQVHSAVTEGYQTDIVSEDRDEIGQITNAVGAIVRETRQLLDQTYQSELDRREAQIQALRSQINPHLLYNTLSNLNWRMIAKGDEEGSRLVTDLSRFYRLSLNGGKTLSTISEELQHTQTYIRLYCATHTGAEPEVFWDIDEGLYACKIPGVILQPLVENAFEHGRPQSGPARLHLCVREEGERVYVSISDNGPGLDWQGKEEMSAEEFFGRYGGYGLRNVYRRLQLLFEEPCTMSFAPSPEGGTSVVLRIPLECGQ